MQIICKNTLLVNYLVEWIYTYFEEQDVILSYVTVIGWVLADLFNVFHCFLNPAEIVGAKYNLCFSFFPEKVTIGRLLLDFLKLCQQ